MPRAHRSTRANIPLLTAALALASLSGCAVTVPVAVEPDPVTDSATSAAPVDVPASLHWSDACLFTVDEVSEIVRPIVENRWADSWSRAESTREGYSGSPGEVGCAYVGDEGMSMLEVVVTPVASALGFEERCADLQGRDPLPRQPDAEAICDTTIGDGLAVSRHRGYTYVYPGGGYVASITLLSVSLGTEVTDVALRFGTEALPRIPN